MHTGYVPFGGEWNFNTKCKHAVHILVLLIISQVKSSIVMYITSILLRKNIPHKATSLCTQYLLVGLLQLPVHLKDK